MKWVVYLIKQLPVEYIVVLVPPLKKLVGAAVQPIKIRSEKVNGDVKFAAVALMRKISIFASIVRTFLAI
ncbi:MAG: hypothetical protein Q8N08_03700 [Methanobacteriaceae archaeon]|nr:hypothetical protein [Methanobacteriaceae archaeon]